MDVRDEKACGLIWLTAIAAARSNLTSQQLDADYHLELVDCIVRPLHMYNSLKECTILSPCYVYAELSVYLLGNSP